MKVIVAGTVAIDDVKTPKVERTGLMGGSASYAAMACSFFAPTRIVGIIDGKSPKKMDPIPDCAQHSPPQNEGP